MRIEDSLLFYEVRKYHIEILCLFYKMMEKPKTIHIEIESECSLNDIERIVKESLYDFGEEYDFDYLNNISYRVYTIDKKQVFRKKAIKYKVVKTKVASKYKKEKYEVEDKKLVYFGNLNIN